MPRFSSARTVRRSAAMTAIALAAGLALASPASAHVEVEAEGASALAENVTLAFTAESESSSAGITKLEVILPEGIKPTDVTYGKGPDGWTLAPTDRGYTVSGPAVAPGKEAAYSVTVRQLPDATSLAFKTLQSYSDNRVDRWIEVDKSGGEGSPAPVLKLEAAAPGAKPVSPSTSPSAAASSAPPSSAPSTQAPAEASPTPAPAAEKKEDTSLALPIGVGVLVVVVIAGAWWFLKRRRSERAV